VLEYTSRPIWLTEALRMQKIFPAALIAGGGRNGGKADFHVAEVKRKILIGRLERLRCSLVLLTNVAVRSCISVPCFPREPLLKRRKVASRTTNAALMWIIGGKVLGRWAEFRCLPMLVWALAPRDRRN
jgi:hypothetical protein